MASQKEIWKEKYKNNRVQIEDHFWRNAVYWDCRKPSSNVSKTGEEKWQLKNTIGLFEMTLKQKENIYNIICLTLIGHKKVTS